MEKGRGLQVLGAYSKVERLRWLRLRAFGCLLLNGLQRLNPKLYTLSGLLKKVSVSALRLTSRRGGLSFLRPANGDLCGCTLHVGVNTYAGFTRVIMKVM